LAISRRDPPEAPLSARWGTPTVRWALLAAVLGSGMAFLDGTVVNVALPSISADLDSDVQGLQWVLDAYLVALTALLLLGGALGDRYGRRRAFRAGVVGFAIASVVCGLAPTTEALVAARAAQGIAGALLVPGSLALLSATVVPGDRSRAVGAWSGLTGVASAIGPFLGGWLIDAASWRWAFLINVPLAVVTVFATRHIPESSDADAPAHLDLAGAAAAAVGLVGLTAGLITAGAGWSPAAVVMTAGGLAVLATFVVVERRRANPMLPPSLFASRQFTGANLVTLAVYAGLGSAFFLVVVQLQVALGYSALEAGTALLPVTIIMLALSARIGALSQRIGARLPMTIGPLAVAGGLLWLGTVSPGDQYLTSVLPAATVFGLGLAITVAPLTAAVLGAVDEHHLGVGSAVNNAVARLAGLLAVALVPSVAGVELVAGADGNIPGYRVALVISAVTCAVGSVIAWLTISTAAVVETTVQPSIAQPCHDPCRAAA
jgi:EmrB/QacA subfamily drug resistance transporter